MTLIRRAFMRAFMPLCLGTATACGGGGTEPPSPSVVAAITANPMASVVGGTIGTAPTFEVRSSKGTALSGIAVSVALTSGGGALVGAPTLSLAGPTPIGQWTLGTVSGPQTVTVTVANVTPLVFTVNAAAGPTTQFAILDGNAQFGSQSALVSAPLRVRVRDTFNNPVAGTTVNWMVDAGGGSLAASTSVTNVDGIAVAPAWTLGLVAAGQQAVVASLGAFNARFTATVQLAPSSLTVEQAAPANATVFTQLTPAPSFAVRDVNGTVLQGVPVTVAITAGNGTLTGAPTLSSLGSTSIGGWRLGTTAGSQSVTVIVSGLPTRIFTVNATPDVATALNLVTGATQIALAGAPVTVAPRVRLIDQFGNGVSTQPVLWTVTAGGGTLGGAATVSTDASGFADSPTWTLGRRGGFQALGASSGLLSQLFSASVQTSFNITLRFVGTPPTGAIAQAFTNAADRITAMIVGDLPDAQIGSTASPFNVSACNSAFTGVTPLNEVVDDVVIYASVTPIDGVGQVLGSAGPCLTRTTGGLTGLGTMRFDSADLDNLANNGRLGDVIAHEMLHVVGLGTLWTSRGLLVDIDLSTVRVTGPLATAACADDLGGSAVCVGSVPAENCLNLSSSVTCGAGTRNSHWKESIFQTELMTGYAGASNLLSKMTVQGLADLGYSVNTLAADPYTVPSSLMALLQAQGIAAAPSATASTPGAPLTELPAPLIPRFTLDRDGRVRPILR